MTSEFFVIWCREERESDRFCRQPVSHLDLVARKKAATTALCLIFPSSHTHNIEPASSHQLSHTIRPAAGVKRGPEPIPSYHPSFSSSSPSLFSGRTTMWSKFRACFHRLMPSLTLLIRFLPAVRQISFSLTLCLPKIAPPLDRLTLYLVLHDIILSRGSHCLIRSLFRHRLSAYSYVVHHKMRESVFELLCLSCCHTGKCLCRINSMIPRHEIPITR